jgi:hypothetical protein
VTPPTKGESGTDPIEDVVEMGRTVIRCKHGPNTWCSCKVRDLTIRMTEVGWTPPHGSEVRS